MWRVYAIGAGPHGAAGVFDGYPPILWISLWTQSEQCPEILAPQGPVLEWSKNVQKSFSELKQSLMSMLCSLREGMGAKSRFQEPCTGVVHNLPQTGVQSLTWR
jgi:hypothetical protein